MGPKKYGVWQLTARMVSQSTHLERTVEWQGEDIAIIEAETGREISYTEFDSLVTKTASTFYEWGVRQGDRVGLVLYNTKEFPIALYACHKLGAVPVPINFMFAEGELVHTFDNMNPELVVYDADVATNVEPAADSDRSISLISVGDAPGSEMTFEQQLETARSGHPPEPVVDTSELSQLIYTSGTTGSPKGVRLSSDTIEDRSMQSISNISIDRHSVFLQLSPWFHTGGLHISLVPAIMVGATQFAIKAYDPGPVLDIIEEYGVTHVATTPTLSYRIANHEQINDRDLSTLQCWMSMGSALTERQAKLFADRITPNIYNFYGTSETFLDAYLRPEDLPEKAGTVGRPPAKKLVRVVENTSNGSASPQDIVQRGESGEIIVIGPIFDGYFGDADETAKAFTDGWYYTGDLGEVSEDGFLSVVGRTDDMILSGGELVSPVEVEDVLEDHENVEAAVVVGVPSDEWGELVKAYVATDGTVSTDELDQYSRDHDGLANYKRPKQFELVSEVSRTATGKKQRFKYRDG